MMRSMVIDMNEDQLQTLAWIQAFLDRTVPVEFSVTLEECCGFRRMVANRT